MRTEYNSSSILNHFSNISPAGMIFPVVVIIGALFVPVFLSPSNIISILFTGATILPAVLGVWILLVLGKFDLSIGGTAAFAGMSGALWLQFTGDGVTATLFGLFVGVAVGAINGLLVTRAGIDPLIVTLASLGAVRSLALVVNEGRIVAGLPDSFAWMSQSRIGDVPILIPVSAICCLLVALGARDVVFCRRLYAVGSNPIAATQAGINVKSTILLGYMLAGFGAAMTGLIQVSRTQSSSPLIFDALAIDAIAACLIGGCALSGGRGTVMGAVLGLMVLVATENIVALLDIPVYWRGLVLGLLLIMAVVWPSSTTTHKHSPPPSKSRTTS